MYGINANPDNSEFSSHQAPTEVSRSNAQRFPPDIHILQRGSIEFGTVHIFKQRHELKFGDSQADLIDVGKHRAALLFSLLQTENLVAIFTEGTSNEYAQSTEAQIHHNQHHEPRLRALFPDRTIPTQPSDEQYVALATSGGCTLVRFFLPQVPVRGTYPEALGTPSPQVLLDPALLRNWTYTEREQMAIREIISFLRQSTPGSHVGLLFGGNHNFIDLPKDMDSGETPRVLTYSFDVPSTLDYSDRILKLCTTDPTGAVAHAKEATNIYTWVWSELTTELQSIVLNKLRTNPDNHSSPEVLLTELIRGISKTKSSDTANFQLQSRIFDLYERKDGPFADLCLHPNGGKLIAESAVTGNLDAAIRTERHPFTQLRMVDCAVSVDWKIFSCLLSVRAQMLALDKLFVYHSDSRDCMYQFLLEYSRSESVKAEVQRRWETSAHPFSK